MAGSGCSEKQSIKDSVKFLKKYGSTWSHSNKPEHYVTHIVQKTDTLQGLALKYNTTMEQIRRINKLFASDSLFLRDILKIPINKELAHSFDGINSEVKATKDEMVSSKSNDAWAYENEKSVDDLFCKIDNSIANTRALVKQVQEQSSVLPTSNYNDLLTHYDSHKKQTHQPFSSVIKSNNDVLQAPHPVVLNHGRKIKSSLQRLEKEQDELFEL